MINADGQPILTDFGIAKLVASGSRLTQTGMGIGTPAYMSPEQAQGLTEVGPEADIYALSVMLFEMLTGRLPFDADTPIAVILKSIKDPLPMPRSLRPDISQALQAVIIKGTAKHPQDRYSTVTEMRAALERTVADPLRNDVNSPTMVARNATTRPMAHDAARATPHRPVVWFASIAAGLAMVAGTYFWATRDSSELVPVAERASLSEPAKPEPTTNTASGGSDVAVEDSADSPKAHAAATPIAELDATAVAGVQPKVVAAPKPAPKNQSAPSVAMTAATEEPLPPAAVSSQTAAPIVANETNPPEVSNASGGLDQVTKGATTQKDLLKLFGGPNLATVDAQGRDVWVYERTVTQTDTRSAAHAASGGAEFSAFWGAGQASASASKSESATVSSSGSSIRTVTVIVTFAQNRTVFDYEIKANYF